MVKSLRRAVAKSRLYASSRWHKWWAWYPVMTTSYELVLWEWVERRRLWRENALGDPLCGPAYHHSTEYRLPLNYRKKRPLPEDCG